MEDIERFEVNGLTVKIVSDPDPANPRDDDDNLGTMTCLHARYRLGDKHDYKTGNEIRAVIAAQPSIRLPLYLYDHSGITMSTSPFSCPWDSGKVGEIWVAHAKIRKEFGVKRLTKKHLAQAKQQLEQEVKTYDLFLTGGFVGFIIEDDGEQVDSCWGIDDIDYAKKEATDIAKAHVPRRTVVAQAESMAGAGI